MNNSSTSLLQKLNDEKAVLLVPAMIFVGVLTVAGMIGNIFICCFYGFKTKTTPTSCLILGLAVFDLLSCSVSMPMEIVDMRYFYMFPDVIICKVLRANSFVCTFSTGILLIAIAIERYRRICLPFRKQITVIQARLICIISALIGCVLSLPSFVLYTVVTVDIPVSGSETIHGYDCTTVKDISLKAYLSAFNICQIVLFIVSSLTLIVLYALMYRQLARQKQFRKYGLREQEEYPQQPEIPKSNMTSIIKLYENEYTPNSCSKKTNVDISDKLTKSLNASKLTNISITQINIGSNSTGNEAPYLRGDSVRLVGHSKNSNHENMRHISLEQTNSLEQRKNLRNPLAVIENVGAGSPTEITRKVREDIVIQPNNIKGRRLVQHLTKKRSSDIITDRFTTLTFVITVTYLVSYLPYLCLVIWRALLPGYEVNQMTDAQLVVFSIGIRSYFLNSTMIPVIYGFFNSQFRTFFNSVCCKCCGAKRT